MKKLFSSRTIKLAVLAVITTLCMCSCAGAGQVVDAANDLFGAVMSSVGGEVGSAVSEGLNEIKSGMSEAASAIESAKDNISEQVSSAGDMVSSEITSAVDEAIGALSSITTVDIVSMSESLDSLANEISMKIDEGISEGSVLISSLNENTAPETSVSSDDTTTVPAAKHYTFRTDKLYDDHYKKHGEEFGNITKDQYLELANELINSDSDRVLHKYSEDGDYMYFDQDTNYFLVLSADGYIRTFFIPSAGIKYWNRK